MNITFDENHIFGLTKEQIKNSSTNVLRELRDCAIYHIGESYINMHKKNNGYMPNVSMYMSMLVEHVTTIRAELNERKLNINES